MLRARIYQNGKSATQQGAGGADLWTLEYEPREGKHPDPLMGWAGSGDTRQQVRMTFPTLEAARAYAMRQGLETEIVPPARRRMILQSYADNFR